MWSIEDLPKILELCAQRGIGMFHLGSAIVPFASHGAFEAFWWEEFEGLFEITRRGCDVEAKAKEEAITALQQSFGS